MGMISVLVIVLGIAAVERGCGSTLGGALAGSLASAKHPIPSILATGTNEAGTNETEIGAVASSSSSEFGCSTEVSACDESGEECVRCVKNLFGEGDDDEDGSGDDENGSGDDDDLSCDERENLYCEYDGHMDNCFENDPYVALIECVLKSSTGCEIDATCSGAMAVARSSGIALIFSATVAGLLAAGVGMT